MKALGSVLLFLPLIGLSQNQSNTSLVLKMYDRKEILVSIDGESFNAISQLKLDNIEAGRHDLKIYTSKKYINPIDNSMSERLIPVYNGEVFVTDNQCTTCYINEYHEKEVRITR